MGFKKLTNNGPKYDHIYQNAQVLEDQEPMIEQPLMEWCMCYPQIMHGEICLENTCQSQLYTEDFKKFIETLDSILDFITRNSVKQIRYCFADKAYDSALIR